MSEKQEKKKRYNQKLELINRFERWAADEPPIFMIFRWKRWLNARPKLWDEIEIAYQLPY